MTSSRTLRKGDNKSHSQSCILTGETKALERCYMLRPSLWKKAALLTRLEWAWGLDCETIQLDTPSNVFYLQEGWARSFDAGQWMLLPNLDLMEKMLDHAWMAKHMRPAQPPPIEDIYEGAEIFEYRLVPLERMLPPIQRNNSSCPTNSSFKTPTTQYDPPFSTLPTLNLPIKPHFAICDASTKVQYCNIDHLYGLLRDALGVPCVSSYVSDLGLTYVAWFLKPSPDTFMPRLRRRRMPWIKNKKYREERVFERCSGPCVSSRTRWTPTQCKICQMRNPNWSKCNRLLDITKSDVSLLEDDSDSSSDGMYVEDIEEWAMDCGSKFQRVKRRSDPVSTDNTRRKRRKQS